MKPKIILLILVVILFSLFFLPKHQEISQKIIPTKAIPEVTFGLIGDINLGRYITYIARSKNDFSYSFAKFAPILQQNDFNLANLEGPIINDCPTGPLDTMIFCGDPQFIPELNKNKFIFNLANNHILNYGQSGLDQTENLLSQQNIKFFNSHYPQTEFYQQNIDGISFGFLGFDLVTYPQFDQSKIIKSIEKYNPLVDWLIISIHWGNEYQPQAESWRVKLAHLMIDAGADIIHGHHPHVLQNNELYKNKPIYYSLGNFIFDQNWSQPTSKSELVNLTVDKNQIIDVTTVPFVIKNNSQPNPIN